MRKIFIAAMAVLLVSVVAYAQSGSADINNIKLTLNNLPWIVAIDGLEKSAGTIQGFGVTDGTLRTLFLQMGICRANVPVKVRMRLPVFGKLETHGTGYTDIITGDYYFRVDSNLNGKGGGSALYPGWKAMSGATYDMGTLNLPHNGIVYGSLYLKNLATSYPTSLSPLAHNLQSDDYGIYTTNLTITYIAQP